MDAEKILRSASGRLESEKTHRIDLLRKESGMDAETFNNALASLAQQKVINLVGGDTSEMTEEQIAGLYNIDNSDLPDVNLVWNQKPVRFLYVFREEILKIYEETGRANKKTFGIIVEQGIIPIAQEMEFRTFNQYIAPLRTLDGLYGTEIRELHCKIETLQGVNAQAKADITNQAEKIRKLEEEVQTEKNICSNLKKRVEVLNRSHNELLNEVDNRTKELDSVTPEPEQITLFDEGDEDMNRIGQLEKQMAEMNATLQKLVAAKPTTTTRPEPEQNHEKFKIGKWAVSFAPRQNAFVAVRRFPGSKSPVSIYCKRDRAKVETILREKLALKGLELD